MGRDIEIKIGPSISSAREMTVARLAAFTSLRSTLNGLEMASLEFLEVKVVASLWRRVMYFLFDCARRSWAQVLQLEICLNETR